MTSPALPLENEKCSMMMQNSFHAMTCPAWRCFALVSLLVSSIAISIGDSSPVLAQQENSLSVMSWNIWHGGKEDGEDIGPDRVAEIIAKSEVDLVAMQETYGSGARISKKLGFHFHPRGTNVSIHSRYPVVEDLSVFEEFKCVGALIELPSKQKVAFFSIWLPYNKEIWEVGTRDVADIDGMKQACQASCDDLMKIRNLIDKRLADEKYRDIPIIIAGDFNSMSHKDYIEPFKDQFDDVVIDWATSQVMTDAKYRDSYRETHPEVDRKRDRTWSPRFPEQQQDRIDYVYYRGPGLQARDCDIVGSHAIKFPSDHAALVTRFSLPENGKKESHLRVASYNIKHGQGNDGKLDLDRTAALLKNLNADLIGLQEVDQECKRSLQIDQPAFFEKRTGMASAFGSFMPFQGGNYGLAILSKHPIESSEEIRLPEGNEPRVALACQIRLPSGEKLTAVNVHFDWVADDKFRFAQAKVVSDFLEKLETPYVLLGDFNDERGSRTLELLSKGKLACEKPMKDWFTFSAVDPVKEIDFIFAAPKTHWKLDWCRVLDGKLTSDHRPVLAVLSLKASD